MRTASLLASLVVAVSAVPAAAQMLNEQAPPLHRIIHRNTLALRYNPLGLIYDGRFAYRFRLYQSDSKALRDNYLGIGIAPTLTPAFVRVGPYVEFNPLTVLGFWAALQVVQYFGSFDLLQGFSGAQANFSDSAIKANSANRQATNGWDLLLGANLTVKVSSLIVRSQARMIFGSYQLREGERVYYDQFYDAALPNSGWTFTNDLDLLYQGFDNRLVAGARYTMTIPLYETRHLDPASDQPADNGMHRVGPFVGWTFKSEDGARFNNPTVFLLVQWWLKHRFRTGLDTPTALPLLGLGFQITGDFLPVK